MLDGAHVEKSRGSRPNRGGIVMTGLSATRRRDHRHPADSDSHSHGGVACVHASRRELCESTEPSKLFGNAAAPLACFQESVLESLFPVCTTTRRKEKTSQVL